MTKAFEERVIKELVVDTEKYSYALVTRGFYSAIVRIEIDKLNTTAALTDWEIVKIYK